jgi:CDP-glucose 4,6-dehydratase
VGKRRITLEEMVIRGEFWAGKKVFVTGHTGFKGAWLALWLDSLGARVAGYALRPPTELSLWQIAAEGSGIASTIADIRDAESVSRAMSAFRPEIVLHLAAQSLVRTSYDDPVGTYATNVMGTINVLEAARRIGGVRAVLNVTSDKCYQNLETGQAYSENDPMGGRDPYSSSKGCAELVTTAYRASFFSGKDALALASARAGNVIGGGDWAADRILPDMVRAAAAGKPVLVRNPNAVRPWQHVLEPLSGYLQLAQQLYAAPRDFAEGWNFGSDNEDAVPVETLVSSVARLWGPPAGWTADKGAHPHEANFLKLDSTKARTRLGWRPRLRLQTALEWTVEWYKEQAQGADARQLTLAQIARYMALATA